jgi:uncharacterized membrane protein
LQTSEEDRFSETDGPHLLNTWSRIYLHGCLALIVVFATAYVVQLLVPFYDFIGSRGLSVLFSILTIVLAPPLIGSLILLGLLPMLGKHEGLRGLDVWDDRVISEITRAKKKTQIVIINWPNKEVRTMGVLTGTFAAMSSDQQLASVYVPTAPQTRYGYIRVVPLEEVEITDWTLKQWQLYQLTFGSAHPGQKA